MEWKTVKLGEVANIQTGPFGSQLHNEDYVLKGTPIVTVEHLGARLFSTQNLPCVSDTDKERLKKYSLIEGDIVFSRVGSVDRCSYVTSHEDGWLFSGRCLRVRTNEDIYPMFLYYYLQKEDIKQSIRNIAVGATMPSINTKLLSEIEVSHPSLETQRRIAAILSSLDDKIENNNRINRNLETQAQALFKSWFVDFEPWGGTMPEDWKEGTIGEMCTCYLGGTPSRAKSEYWNGDIPWINSGEVNKFRIIEGSEYITELGLKKSATKLLPKKTTVLAITGATLGQVSLLEIEACANQSVIGILENEKMPYEFIYPLIVNDIEKIILNQTGGAQQHINKDNVASHNIIIPTDEIMAKYKAIQAPLFETIANNCLENHRLAALRDTLLPKLMRGEITL